MRSVSCIARLKTSDGEVRYRHPRARPANRDTGRCLLTAARRAAGRGAALSLVRGRRTRSRHRPSRRAVCVSIGEARGRSADGRRDLRTSRGPGGPDRRTGKTTRTAARPAADRRPDAPGASRLRTRHSRRSSSDLFRGLSLDTLRKSLDVRPGFRRSGSWSEWWSPYRSIAHGTGVVVRSPLVLRASFCVFAFRTLPASPAPHWLRPP